MQATEVENLSVEQGRRGQHQVLRQLIGIEDIAGSYEVCQGALLRVLIEVVESRGALAVQAANYSPSEYEQSGTRLLFRRHDFQAAGALITFDRHQQLVIFDGLCVGQLVTFSRERQWDQVDGAAVGA